MRTRVPIAVTCALLVFSVRADATVTQVDGTILPVSNRLQVALDAAPPNGEGPGQIDAILDAAEFPQIFLPNLTIPVVFRDVVEGAGFENSFGWYNVGDDVLTPAGRNANLHPIMGCGIPMVAGAGDATHHSGNPAFYVQNAEPPNQISVDFAAEQTAGRYKGGFIGFYLITPENNPSANNCGDFKNGSDGLSLFGFIYFTQKDLNNDGDFVHHLVYQSKTTANRFYFGFEDLFRGGDNDFEDMAMRVEGLTPPCIPQAEVCDGIDNDCDGVVDGADPDLTGTNDPCTCDGVALACDNGPRFGQCQSGVTVCDAGVIECHGTGTGGPELCDGVDNNCNNIVDDNPSGTGAACDGTDADLCPEGTIICSSGALVCSDTTGPNQETCNGVDDDCNGMTDEGNPGGGASCGSSLGVCTPGTMQCQGGSLICVGATGGGPETCNGLDDDCDGVVDDNPTDVGVACGATDEGECDFGQTICVGGSLSCAGEVGPSPERCNGLDDDCNTIVDDDPVDVGQPCGTSTGACDPGTFICVMGGLVCSGGTGPTAETCNAVDDDCDGIIDEDVPGEGQACGGGMGPCSGGMTACIAGTMQCVGGTSGGTETCNNVDDDCDSMIDEGDLCNGGVCDNGVCAAPCAMDEIPCPSGKICVDDFCVDDPCFTVSCPPDANGELQTCVDGGCVALCSVVQCPIDPPGLVCRGSDGACVPNNCDYLPLCTADEICVDGLCAADPCLGVSCGGDQFCRGGTCVDSCAGVHCAQGFECRDGTCAPTGCTGSCGDQVCNPDTGQCQPSACTGVQCSPHHVCNPLDGSCVVDPCNGVTCPGDQTCSDGQCGVEHGSNIVGTGGGGGCDAGAGGPRGGGLALPLLAAIGVALRRRRNRARLGRLALAAAVLGLALAGCKVNDYCLDCEQVGEDANPGDDGGHGDGGTPICDPSVIHPETCNHADDDCDGSVDETFDLMTDEMNCGDCGVQCNKPGAITSCTGGGCGITGCFPGFVDRDGDTAGPYDASNGCEYMCFLSNGGVEACDGLDNDCDGTIDEDFDLSMDDNNCGQCGRTCDFFEATGHCVSNTCEFDPAVDCQPGYIDIDGDQTNGCEYECSPTNGGVEACDVEDNDCDGQIDEDFDFENDAANCGRCGLVCQFPHATASCTLSTCGFDPAIDCDPGFVDVDGQQLDGCEYACSPTNGGTEICDGVDNDCDGVADDSPVDAGGACAATTPPTGQCIADGVLTCASGSLVCAGATQPTIESCDNVDNDCDGPIDDGVSQACYDGPAGTEGIGACRGGTETCVAGGFGACSGEVTPGPEQCNNIDDDCNSMIDEDASGNPISRSCYGGPGGTQGVGTCVAGTQTCAFGAFGSCFGEVDPSADICGDGADTDCDGLGDTGEGCQVLDAELRLDAGGAPPGGGALGTAAGAQHSYDLVLASGGSPLGTNVYAAWSELVGTVTEVYFRRSTDGGQTWGTILNLTASVAPTAVKPTIAVAAGATDRVVVTYQTVTGGVRDIRAQVSTDSGQTFGAATAALDASGDSFHQAVAARGLTVVIAWERLNTATLTRDVISRASTDGGTTFGAEVVVNVGSGATHFAGRPQVGITGTGGVVWAWREQRAGSTRDMFAAAVATATGTPAADVRIDGDTLDRRDSDFPVLRVEENRAYLVWQDVSTVSGGGADAMFARSTNGGTSWGAERILDDPAAEVSSSFTPTIALDPRNGGGGDDLIAVAWEDRRQGTQVFASVSTDGGASFSAARRASSNAGDPITGQTSAPQIATGGDGVLAVAYQNQQTGQNPHVFIATSIDAGATWTYTHAQLDGGVGEAVTPQATGARVGGQSAAVAGWTDFRAGTHVNGDIYVAVDH